MMPQGPEWLIIGFLLSPLIIAAVVIVVVTSRNRSSPPSPPWPTSSPGTAAGWYPDPSGRFAQRYWDGAAWTEKVSGPNGLGTDPL